MSVAALFPDRERVLIRVLNDTGRRVPVVVLSGLGAGDVSAAAEAASSAGRVHTNKRTRPRSSRDLRTIVLPGTPTGEPARGAYGVDA